MKRTVTQEALENCERYLNRHARALDKVRFRHAFRQAAKEDIIAELAAFQNLDGGFGHALESDAKVPDPSPVATDVALNLLVTLGADVDAMMVRTGVAYLLDVYDGNSGRWFTMPASVNNYPHASWWHYDEEAGGTLIDRTAWNPTASLTAHLLHYRELCPSDLLDDLCDRAVIYLSDRQDDDMEMHELDCFARLATRLPRALFEKVHKPIVKLVTRTVVTDVEQWKAYGAQPLFFVKDPDSFMYEHLVDSLEMNLDYWIDELSEAGAWQPPWSWDRYEKEWAQVKPEIAGALSVERLLILQRFGRV
jgi:hypothetical protein